MKSTPPALKSRFPHVIQSSTFRASVSAAFVIAMIVGLEGELNPNAFDGMQLPALLKDAISFWGE